MRIPEIVPVRGFGEHHAPSCALFVMQLHQNGAERKEDWNRDLLTHARGFDGDASFLKVDGRPSQIADIAKAHPRTGCRDNERVKEPVLAREIEKRVDLLSREGRIRAFGTNGETSLSCRCRHMNRVSCIGGTDYSRTNLETQWHESVASHVLLVMS